MTGELDQALLRLDAALGQMEAAAQRRLNLDRRRGEIESELALMQDDRARLAIDLDGALARANAAESAATDAIRRIDSAMHVIRDIVVADDGVA
ncbi:MAG: DUF4164 family protein [Bosea sp. (in: a-proteobacteria)]